MPLVYDHLPTVEAPEKRVKKRDFPYYCGAWAFAPSGTVVRLWGSSGPAKRLVGTSKYDLLPSGENEGVRIQMIFASGLAGNLPSCHCIPVQLELLAFPETAPTKKVLVNPWPPGHPRRALWRPPFVAAKEGNK
jgi:hypothetical protein